MGKHEIIKKYEKERMKKNLPEFRVGDTLRVKCRILEEGGKERLQSFEGTVIAKKGEGISETVSLHRVAYGEGMERVFYLHSPLIHGIEVVSKGHVRKSKLYYLRGASGKAAKVKSRFEAEEGAELSEEASNVAK